MREGEEPKVGNSAKGKENRNKRRKKVATERLNSQTKRKSRSEPGNEQKKQKRSSDWETMERNIQGRSLEQLYISIHFLKVRNINKPEFREKQ